MVLDNWRAAQELAREAYLNSLPERAVLMYPVFVSHQDFLRQIEPLTKRRALRKNGAAAFHAYRQAEAMVRSANLDFLAPVLLPLYAPDGRGAAQICGGNVLQF